MEGSCIQHHTHYILHTELHTLYWKYIAQHTKNYISHYTKHYTANYTEHYKGNYTEHYIANYTYHTVYCNEHNIAHHSERLHTTLHWTQYCTQCLVHTATWTHYLRIISKPGMLKLIPDTKVWVTTNTVISSCWLWRWRLKGNSHYDKEPSWKHLEYKWLGGCIHRVILVQPGLI